MSVALPEGNDLELPEWIQCDGCEKWRKLPTEYVLTVRVRIW